MRSGVYITCSLLLLSGCAHGNWRQSVARVLSRDGVPTAVPQQVDRVPVEVVKMHPDNGPVPRASVPLLRAQNQDNPGVALTSSSAGKTPVISHDAATLALIDKETRDFPPADRDRAIAALKAIPSESVSAVLQLWKAGLISPLAHPTSPVILAPATAADLPPPTTLASYTEPPVDVALGQKSPWQNQNVRRSDDTSQASNGQPALGNEVRQTSQIARVGKPVMGYSSPFPEASDFGTTNGVATFEQASAKSPGGSGTGSHWSTPAGHQTGFHPVVPADWQSASASLSNDRDPNGGNVQSFSTATGRRVVMPSDWQANFQQPSAPRFSYGNDQPVPALVGSAPPDSGEGPVIRPQARSPESAPVTPPQPTIQRIGFSEADPEGNSPEIALVPGQMLPGFEHLADIKSPRMPQSTQHRPVPHEPHIQFDAHASGIPPEAPRLQSSGEALQFLTRATEAEVALLKPGQTAEELQYYIERHVYLRLLYLMSGQAEPALRPIPDVPATDQEFWTQVLWGVNNYFDLPRIPNHAERAAQTISQFNTAMLRLKERAPLELKHATFCHKIDGYGEYDTYSKDEFTPGQRVLVYAEIDNFHSELSTEGIYRTRLKSTLQVITAEAPQEPVDVKTYPVTEDYCRNHRRDYFHSYVVEIPVRCVRGSHVLKLIIEDELSGKTAEYSVPFVVR